MRFRTSDLRGTSLMISWPPRSTSVRKINNTRGGSQNRLPSNVSPKRLAGEAQAKQYIAGISSVQGLQS